MLIRYMLAAGPILLCIVVKQTYSADEILEPIVQSTDTKINHLDHSEDRSDDLGKQNPSAVSGETATINEGTVSYGEEVVVNSTRDIDVSRGNRTEDQNNSSEGSPQNLTMRNKPSKRVQSKRHDFESYLMDVYKEIEGLRNNTMKKIEELKEYLMNNNDNRRLGSTDDVSKRYYSQKDADFIVARDIGQREGREFLQDKVDSILEGSVNLNNV